MAVSAEVGDTLWWTDELVVLTFSVADVTVAVGGVAVSENVFYSK